MNLRFAGMTLIALIIGCSAKEEKAPVPPAEAPLTILVPTEDNLQMLTFWLALDRYEAAGYATELLVPPAPQATRDWLTRHRPDLAILPAPVLLDHLARGTPMGPARNLLTHDPINLVVRRSVAEARGLGPEQPLHERLIGLEGLRIGIARRPPPRLRALFATEELEADEVVEVVHVGGKRQNRAFANGDVDALFAHTPHLEHALLHQDAVLIVGLSGGQVDVLANRVIHCAVASPELAKTRPEALERFFDGLSFWHRRVREAPAEAAAVLKRRFPERDPAEIDLLVSLYKDAVPEQLAPTVEGLEAALRFYPEGFSRPTLDRATLERFVRVAVN